ncbi:hypothetical protein ACP70R_022796 [Stipagrostis hirtigluma subsp. patula]
MASASSSSRPQDSSESGDEIQSSPIRYREGPLEYEPPVFCGCHKKAARWISWGNKYPGRRYFKCFRARMGGCRFWAWFDPDDTSPFIKQVIRDLRDTVRALRRENAQLRHSVSEVQRVLQLEAQRAVQLEVEREEVEDFRRLLAVKETGTDLLVQRIKNLEKQRFAFMIVTAACVCVVAFMVLK